MTGPRTTPTGSLLPSRELIRSDEMWTLMYLQDDGSWHEVSGFTRTSLLKYALEDKADAERRYPNDTYRLAILRHTIEFPVSEDLK